MRRVGLTDGLGESVPGPPVGLLTGEGLSNGWCVIDGLGPTLPGCPGVVDGSAPACSATG